MKKMEFNDGRLPVIGHPVKNRENKKRNYIFDEGCSAFTFDAPTFLLEGQFKSSFGIDHTFFIYGVK